MIDCFDPSYTQQPSKDPIPDPQLEPEPQPIIYPDIGQQTHFNWLILALIALTAACAIGYAATRKR